MQLVGHQDPVGESAFFGLLVLTQLGEEPSGDNGILMLAEYGLQLFGVPRDGFHLAVRRFDEFSGIPRSLGGLPRPMQLFDVIVSLPQPLVGLSLGLLDILDRRRVLLTSRLRQRRYCPPATQQLHQVVIVRRAYSL